MLFLKVNFSIRLLIDIKGSVRRIPLIHVEGLVIKGQLIETKLLTLVNYASLVATNAVRFHRTNAGEKIFREFDLRRRAQGLDGGLTASE